MYDIPVIKYFKSMLLLLLHKKSEYFLHSYSDEASSTHRPFAQTEIAVGIRTDWWMFLLWLSCCGLTVLSLSMPL